MARVLFVTEDYIKTNSVIDDEISAQVLMVVAFDSQEMYIEPLLGSRLYNKVKADVTASTLTGDYLTLMTDYIVPTLLKFIEKEIIPINSLRIRNVGATTKSGEFGQSATIKNMEFIMNLAQNKADLIAMKMVDYLKCNTDNFPEYCDNDEGGEIHPLNSATKTGIYLGQAKRYENKDDRKRYYNS